MRRDFESKKTRNDEGLAGGQFEELVAFFGSKDRAGFVPFLSVRTIGLSFKRQLPLKLI